MVTIQVPIPPSANHIHAYAKGRVRRSQNYQIWLTQCRYLLGQPGAVPGVVGIEITVEGGKGWRANRDLDNIIKPILDLLRHLGVIEEDNTGIVHRISVSFTPPPTKAAEAVVSIKVKSIPEGVVKADEEWRQAAKVDLGKVFAISLICAGDIMKVEAERGTVFVELFPDPESVSLPCRAEFLSYPLGRSQVVFHEYPVVPFK